MSHSIEKPLLLEARRTGLIRTLVVVPASAATLWLALDVWRRGEVEIATAILATAMYGLALWGLLFALKPYRLVADGEGIHWSYGIKRQLYRWSEIEEIGIARRKGTEGWDSPVARVLTGGGTRDLARFRKPLIGLNLIAERSPYKEAGERAYRRGFTGFDVNVPNEFDAQIETVVDELRVRWLSATSDVRLGSGEDA